MISYIALFLFVVLTTVYCRDGTSMSVRSFGSRLLKAGSTETTKLSDSDLKTGIAKFYDEVNLFMHSLLF